MPKAAFTTLGCKVNQYETQKILESFAHAGFEIVPFDAPADVYVLNTCSVTGQAESKSRYAARKARRSNPDARVVVTGCAAQMALNTGQDGFDADLTVPNPEKLETFRRFADRFPELLPPAPVTPAPLGRTGRTRATLKVQDGCDVLCSYCSIPFTRPVMASRPWQDVLAEARQLAEAGYLEAVLTGVLIGSYGPETGSGGPGFEELVGLLCSESGLARLRISSIEMHQVTPPIIELARSGQIVPHFHIPLQSGDDQVLRDMNRRYDSAQFVELCHRLVATVPDVALTTDVMVGFPTETAERFESSVRVLEECEFLKAHVFRFSPRPGTPADQWGDPVSPPDKQERARVLSAIAARTGAAFVRRFVGRTLPVIVEGKMGRDGLFEGVTDNWVTVKFAAPESMARTMQQVRIDEERDGVAYGELTSGALRSELPVSASR